jgi:hypothetical protein
MSQYGRQQADFSWLDCLLFPWGLSWLDGNNRVSARWEDVVTLTQESVAGETIPAPAPYVRNAGSGYTLVLANGQSKTFYGSGLTHPKAPEPTPGTTKEVNYFRQLAALLELYVARAQLPKAINSFDAGQTISFGSLTVNRDGIATRNRSLPWSEIKGARILAINGVVLEKLGVPPWWLFSAQRVPNYSLFVALVRAILARSPSTPPR